MYIWKEYVFWCFGISKSNWSNLSYKTSVARLIFFQDDLSTDVCGMLNPILLLHYCRFLLCLLIFALNIRSPCTGRVYINKCNILFLYWFLYHYLMPVFVFWYRLCFKLYFFFWFVYCYPCFLTVSICMKYLFLSFHFQSVFSSKMSLLLATFK